MLNLVIALQCEAQPLIDSFRLKRDSSHHVFPIYTNDNITLVICGIGKINAANACGYLAGMQCTADKTPAAWLNVGIIGGASLPVGDIFLAHSIKDRTTQSRFYPAILFKLPCTTYGIITADSPETEYHEDTPVDMEGAGFFSAATRYSTVELIHVIKIVSDNKKYSAENLDKQQATRLVSKKMGIIEKVIGELQNLCLAENKTFTHQLAIQWFFAKWHFTRTQQHQLKLCLQRWQALGEEANQLKDSVSALDSADNVIKLINSLIDDCHYQF